MRSLRVTALCLAALCLLLLSAVRGPAETLTMEATDTSVPWSLEADRIVGRQDSEILEAQGNVVLRQGDDYLKADFARYFRKTNWVFLKGAVEADWRGDQLRAEQAEFDLTNMVGWLKKGSIFVANPHLYFSGDFIRKHWGDSYSFKNAKVTACDPESPAWSMEAREGDITLDGHVRLWSASFRIKDTPVLATPYLAIPIKTKRRTGLLFPEMGYSSKLGAYYNQPYYWNIDEESDATFYENAMSKRGVMQGAEYRRNSRDTKAYLRADWLHDFKRATDESNEDSPFDEDGLIRTNRERYWARGKINTTLPGSRDWKVKLDLDLVSDQNYLREFSSGLSGFKASRKTFLKEFGRDITDADQNRTSTLNVSRSWDRFGMSASAEYTQNVDYGHGNTSLSRDPTLQKLPEVSGYLFKDSIAGPLEMRAGLTATNFWRRYGTSGTRLDVHPRISVPLRSKYGTIIPSLGWRQTIYGVDWHESDSPGREGSFKSRGLPDMLVSAYTEAYRVMGLSWGTGLALSRENVNKSRWTSLKHNIQPRLAYSYIPRRDQDDLPQFDAVDSIDGENQITYSLSNILSRKRQTVVMQEGKDGKARPAFDVDYRDIVRFRLEQGYDFNEAKRTDLIDQYPQRPLTDTLAELSVMPGDYVTLTSRSWFSPYLSSITEHEHSLTMEWPNRVTAMVGLDFQESLDEYKRRERKRISAVRTAIKAFLTPAWSVSARWDADIQDGRDLQKELMINYAHDCFELGIAYAQDSYEDRVEILINLMGFNMF
ncbi:MAG: LPS-assembly protein LptD [Desulfovibrionaceae bacterium]|nr:LPS-assembly protein LptD [Desulfovibrionaceae bacterium]